MQGRSICHLCVHLSDEGDNSCAAFPAGIPDEIIHGGFDHRDPFDGDNGILFQPDPGVTPEQVDLALFKAEPPPLL